MVGTELSIGHNDVVHTGPNCPFTQAASVSKSTENIPASPWQPPFTIIIAKHSEQDKSRCIIFVQLILIPFWQLLYQK